MVLGVILLLVHNCIHYFQLKFIWVLEFLHFQLGSKYLTKKIKFCNKSASKMEVISFSFIYFKFQFVLKKKLSLSSSSSSISWNRIYCIYTSDYSNKIFYNHQSIYIYISKSWIAAFNVVALLLSHISVTSSTYFKYFLSLFKLFSSY